MYPQNGEQPLLDLAAFPRLEAVVDVIYNPLRSNLVLQAQALGLQACGGLEMLVAPAKWLSIWRNFASPCSAKMSAIAWPLRRTISLSQSSRGRPNLSASKRPTVLLPQPGIPVSRNGGQQANWLDYQQAAAQQSPLGGLDLLVFLL